MIKPHQVISLGGGSNVAQLTQAIAVAKLPLQLFSPSNDTRQLGAKLKLQIAAQPPVTAIDLAFDGCDSLNQQLQALKSRGGIHTLEKIFAAQAKRYCILAPHSRMKAQLDPALPLTLEVIPLASNQVINWISQFNNYQPQLRKTATGTPQLTINGNQLVDCYATNDWQHITEFNQKISLFNGVVGTSYFENLVTEALLFDPDEKVHYLRKDELK